jgi:hypothetical protein
MGLDQSAFTTDKSGNVVEIAYWRKHPNLQGWMANLYREKEGGVEEFNGIGLELDKDDINRLEKAITNNVLPYSIGFFYGEPKDHFYKNQDLEFCKDAHKAICNKQTVTYRSNY